MGKYVTISVKIPREIKEKLEKLGIKPSELLKKAVEEELLRVEVQEIKREIEKLKYVFTKFNKEFIVKSIREDREEIETRRLPL
ncbi:MAG: hypothetical protein QXX09_02610 [Candidatus Methanomethylicia archaeon]